MHPCAEYAIIKSNIDVLFIAETATMESTFLYVRKVIGKTLSGAPAPAPPKGELCAIFRAAAPSVWKKLVTGTQKKLPLRGNWHRIAMTERVQIKTES